ncbi:MAG: methylated-DNA--[protein]-cysteine S-methyltransferase [Flavobacteriales bacterium]
MKELVSKVAVIDTPVGKIRLQATGELLQRLDFVDETEPLIEPDAFLLQVKCQLEEYFDGRRTRFEIPLHADGTHFQMNVWDQLIRINYGQTWSYEDLARQLGDKKVIRAAATANGKNPIAIIIPCHRVIGKDGTLTGYSGGLWRKKYLLNLELGQKAPALFSDE